MKIYSKIGPHEYEHEYFKFYDFDQYSKNIPDDIELYIGLDWILKDQIDIFKNNIHKKIFVNQSLPCELFANNFSKMLHAQLSYDIVYNSCPYSSNYLNKILGTEKFKFIPIPNFTKKFFENYENIDLCLSDKVFDTAYIGGIHSHEHLEILKSIKNFKHFLISFQRRNYLKWPINVNFLGYKKNEEKWKMQSMSKTLVCTNLLYLSEDQIEVFKNNILVQDDYMKKIIETKTAPQMKGRVIEAASTNTLILMKKDPWNLIEEWFTPNEDFIYWENTQDLKEKIKDISKNFDNYTHIIKNAKKKVSKYYFEEFLKNISLDLSNL